MALRQYEKPLVVTDSGGKDSAVCRELVRRSGVPHELMHNLTTADAPQTIYYVREQFKRAEEAGISCSINYPYYKGKRITMWSLIPMKKIPPTRLARYCCEVLKENSGVKQKDFVSARRYENPGRCLESFRECRQRIGDQMLKEEKKDGQINLFQYSMADRQGR